MQIATNGEGLGRRSRRERTIDVQGISVRGGNFRGVDSGRLRSSIIVTSIPKEADTIRPCDGVGPHGCLLRLKDIAVAVPDDNDPKGDPRCADRDADVLAFAQAELNGVLACSSDLGDLATRTGLRREREPFSFPASRREQKREGEP